MISQFSRRDWHRLVGSAVAYGLGGSLWDGPSAGQVRAAQPAEKPGKPGKPDLPPLNRFSRVVQEYYVEQVRSIARRTAEVRAAIQTRDQALAYVADVRRRIRDSFGPEPERTPLNPRVTGVVDRESYRIEKVIFESRPKFFVTANLYVPKGHEVPRPAVVGSCGHSTNGKASEAYQAFAQSLARLGYICLIFDPIGQGERLQYVDRQLKPRRGIGVTEHLYAGNQQFLVGEFLGSWRAWDGIRALDYLLTREEVDPKHIGVTGNSGGGTMTTWLCGVESRWTMAAPSCFVTTFLRNLENELPADTEQCPPRAIALGLDHADFLAAMAPKPVIVLAKERDYFDARGATEAYQRLKHLYTALGAPDNVSLFIGPTEHGYSQENREAMYAWFHRATGQAAPGVEPPLTIEKDEVLQCTQRGQVAELDGTTVFEETRAKSRALGDQRQPLAGDELRAAVRDVLRLPPDVATPPEYRILRPLGNRHYPRPHATTYAVESEPGVFAVVTRLQDRAHYSRPPQGPARAILYVAHQSSDEELRTEGLAAELIKAEPAAAFYACDVRGIGESRPDTCGADQFSRPYGSDYFYAIHGLMLDKPYVGQKTWDLLRVLDWLGAAGHSSVHLVGSGWGSVPATFAAVLSDRVTQVTLEDALKSYASIAESDEYTWPLSSFVPNVLARFDLPDCYSTLRKTKKLSLVG